MADSTIQVTIEKWVRENWLPAHYDGQVFRKLHVELNTEARGKFEFDAVSQDKSIIANISTSNATTSGGNPASAKMQKLRSDMLFLLMASARKKLVVLTEQDMFDLCEKEKSNGRIPDEIEFVYANGMPENLQKLLIEAKRIAAREVTPEVRL